MIDAGCVAAMQRVAAAGGGAIPTAGLLAAYSVRRVVPAYAGALLRVRRSSDNAESDVGFDGSGHLDTAALATFVGAGTGLIATWYDQSGNGQHAVQATAARQPVIAASAIGGRPGIGFQDAGAIKALTLPAGVGTVRTFVIVAQLDYATLAAASAAGVAGGDWYIGLLSRSSTRVATGYVPANGWITPPWNTTYNDGVVQAQPGNLPADLSIPHVYEFITPTGLAMAGGHIGSEQLNSNRSWEGEFAELLLYDAVLATADREAAEDSAIAYYGI